MKSIIVLGLNFGGHDTSACLMKDGILIEASEALSYTHHTLPTHAYE